MAQITAQQEITAGENICLKLKHFYFGRFLWSAEVAWEIGVMLAILKKQALVYFPDSDILYRLHHMDGWPKEDFDDAFLAQRRPIFTDEEWLKKCPAMKLAS
jgi:hypothetical protein